MTELPGLHTYGQPPFDVAVLHGGPGAPGEMAPVARRLSRTRGVLEPMQSARSIDGQVAELRRVLEEHAALPVVLIGYSWGAFLGLIVAARHPSLVRKLFMIGSGPLEERDAASIMPTRLSRLDQAGRDRVQRLVAVLEASDDPNALAELGSLLSKADLYDPIDAAGEPIAVQQDIYGAVWGEAQALRASGELLDLARRVACPVVAIHGDYDPHPVDGVERPLRAVLPNFKFVLLERCGHTPWRERHASQRFFEVIERELALA